ncbi:hypothetical protein, partial [Vibrio sp. S12_S33]|uniref:hypothetical protein n=1 Tax=Vibrio sp. S12_S33 TaxID=2720223 RepID=UPI003080DE60
SKNDDYRISLFLCSEVSHFVLESKSHNKQFKWILNAWQFYYALSKVFYGAMQRLGQCVVHHLIGR